MVKVAIKCSNCGKETMINVDNLNTSYQDIITTFAFNKILHHVGMLWIIEDYEQLKYDTDIQNSDCMTGGPWYNTSIWKKLHGKLFEGFIKNARTDRYHIMCYIDTHEKLHHSSSCDDGISGGGCLLPKYSTTEALILLGATIYFIGCWLKGLEHNLLESCNLYTYYMEELFQKIPVELPNKPSPKEKLKSLLHAIGGGWYVYKLGQKLPPIKKKKINQKIPKEGG